MSFNIIKKVISPSELLSTYPLTAKDILVKQERDRQIKDVFTGNSDKFIVIIGPCSADNEDSVLDYINRLARVQEKVKDKLILIPRIYTNKPRTTGEGYKGIAHQPDPEKEPDLQEGLIAMRKIHLRAIAETGLTAADEMLYPENWPYVEDILSYVAVGARSVEDQQHRLTISGMDCPAGMKNPTSGDFSVMLNSCVAAQANHTFLYRAYEVETSGNPLAHAILRGAVNKHGQSIPNYHYEDLVHLLEMYNQRDLANPAVIVDANHANSNKLYSEQPRIVGEVLHSRQVNSELAKLVKGVMIESYIESGSQKISEHIYGKSITDACLGWEESEKLLYYIADRI
ncbi:phospho-2-dehydro-3-deoxyheptonate aldolase [Anaerocolumna cellulosilytica]|uniref:Phospho-2-dehydro-3-deoxyheptonate aldolase n=1 Tax=Anaerocolumna cellulosilytica TaxID=433286 RepID=A0A6S6R8I8_9FIRM|nr:3-deoxy-7-phosphoheptulonate synthase [Anaerocolumna cellulosilytica]MBB5197105.1 3-deoxy-7-phosphoheptulonate synthase [Anaerocolumna cellulosilytica]BCJ95318.1 phospho-2-dehydro-3-deoxyheptonate aldolase [Anaerocolumna cellulosilytica]